MWVIAVLGSLAALLIIVLYMPFEMAVCLDVHGRPKFSLKLRTLFGLINKEIRTGKRKRKPEEKKEIRRKSRGPGIKNVKKILDILTTKGLLRRFKDLLKGLIKSLRFRDFEADLRIGVGNPAYTGLLFVAIGPVVFFLSSVFPKQIKVRPSFAGEAVLEGYLYGVIRVQLIQLAVPLIKFVFSLPTFRVLVKLIKGGWRGKK